MSTKHTEGTWYIDTTGKRADYIRASGDQVPGTCAIAQLCARGGWSEQQANARLIAAAPDLLKALQALVDLSDSEGLICGPRVINNARAAIAKAAGEQ